MDSLVLLSFLFIYFLFGFDLFLFLQREAFVNHLMFINNRYVAYSDSVQQKVYTQYRKLFLHDCFYLGLSAP